MINENYRYYDSYNLIMYMIKLFQTPGMYGNVHLHCLGLLIQGMRNMQPWERHHLLKLMFLNYQCNSNKIFTINIINKIFT